jgi:GxxExxY protein
MDGTDYHQRHLRNLQLFRCAGHIDCHVTVRTADLRGFMDCTDYNQRYLRNLRFLRFRQEVAMTDKEYKYSDITHKIIGSAMKVHSMLGNGFQEVIYQRAMAIEMTKQGLSFQRELEMQIYYDGQEIGTRRVDFLVEDKVMVELKALTGLEDVHLAQAINYLEAYHLEIGLLLNFGAKSLEYRRLINSKKHR